MDQKMQEEILSKVTDNTPHFCGMWQAVQLELEEYPEKQVLEFCIFERP